MRTLACACTHTCALTHSHERTRVPEGGSHYSVRLMGGGEKTETKTETEGREWRRWRMREKDRQTDRQTDRQEERGWK